MTHTLTQHWNLDSLFTAGEFLTALDRIDQRMTDLEKQINEASVLSLLHALQETGGQLEEADMFVHALRTQDMQDANAQAQADRIGKWKAHLATLQIQFDKRLHELPESEWSALLADPTAEPVAYLLQERRRQMEDKLPSEQEQLASRLATNGYHAWGNLRHRHVGRMRFIVNDEELHIGQVWGLLSHPDRATREAALDSIDQAFSKDAELFEEALNALSGYRLDLYQARGWDSLLKEPLDQNQISEQTLDTMHEVLEQHAPKIAAFLHRKARLMGLEKLSHFDITAPLDQVNSEIEYEQAASMILEHFDRFSPDLAEMASRAFSEGWIDSENRPGKGFGGVCIPFHLADQSRISINFRGQALDLLVLAHELGHAYHNAAISDLPYLARQYPMSVAETASTFAEVILMNALIDTAASDEERRRLLAEKLQRVIPFQLLGVFSGYLLERSIYEERKNGRVPHARLNELAIQAQKRAYADALDRYHPYQWAMQPHIYATEVPFYNFQYTFGYLFSIGIYAKALQDGPAFAKQYRELLRNTGRMNVEELASRFIGADLTQPEFWQHALELIVQDVNEFLRLTE